MVALVLVIFVYLKYLNPENRPAGDRVTAEERRVNLNAILLAMPKQSFSKRKNIEWKKKAIWYFNPPGASHQKDSMKYFF